MDCSLQKIITGVETTVTATGRSHMVVARCIAAPAAQTQHIFSQMEWKYIFPVLPYWTLSIPANATVATGNCQDHGVRPMARALVSLALKQEHVQPTPAPVQSTSTKTAVEAPCQTPALISTLTPVKVNISLATLGTLEANTSHVDLME
jgi:hypothetical protein